MTAKKRILTAVTRFMHLSILHMKQSMNAQEMTVRYAARLKCMNAH